jgi:ABC-type enterochelin transport system permease subunit
MKNEIASVDLWQSKPWWCQPWTIIVTGVLLVAGSWIVLHSMWLTIPLSILIVVWWTYFLILVPRMLRQLAADSPIDNFDN